MWLWLLFSSIAAAQDYVNNPVFHFERWQPAVTQYVKPYPSQARSSPQVWSGQNSFSPKELEDLQFNPGSDLEELFRIGLGPRRKRRSERTFDSNAHKVVTKTIETLMDMPLFCWKIFVNCQIFPKHICCPAMYQAKKKQKKKQKQKPERSKREVDPLFGIPIVAQKRNDYKHDEGIKHYQEWKPYSPYYIGLPGYDERK